MSLKKTDASLLLSQPGARLMHEHHQVQSQHRQLQEPTMPIGTLCSRSIRGLLFMMICPFISTKLQMERSQPGSAKQLRQNQ